MENTFKRKFESYIDNESITILNEILNNKDYTKEQRNIVFQLALCIIHTNYRSIKPFYELCKNDKIINNNSFLQLLSRIINECQKLSSYNQNSQIKDSLGYKINAIITVMYHTPNLEEYLDDIDFINILNGILTEELERDNYKFICQLCQNEIMKNNYQKRNIALEVVLNSKVNITTINSDLYPYALSVLANEDVLSLDNTTYRKVISTVIVNIQSYPLSIVLEQENLTPTKRKAIIDYYYDILDKYLKKYWAVDINKVKRDAQAEIFSVVYSNRLLSMSDEEYVKTLKQIRECNKPLSYAIVLSSDEINEEQLKIALELISKGPVEKRSEYSRTPETDYKYNVATIAISPVLTKLPIEEYKKFITLINSYCEQAERFNENKEYGKRDIIYSKINQIVTLFYNSTLYGKNKERLLIAIDEINSADDNRHLIEQIGKFCNHNNSAYYSESEYKTIIKLLKQEYLISSKEKNGTSLML